MRDRLAIGAQLPGQDADELLYDELGDDQGDDVVTCGLEHLPGRAAGYVGRDEDVGVTDDVQSLAAARISARTSSTSASTSSGPTPR